MSEIDHRITYNSVSFQKYIKSSILPSSNIPLFGRYYLEEEQKLSKQSTKTQLNINHNSLNIPSSKKKKQHSV